MFKKITTLFLLAAISLQILNRAVIYIDYYANTGAYAKNCINKALPVMHCNGKCQMMKKLKEQEKKESELPGKRIGFDEVISSKSFFSTVPAFNPAICPAYNLFTAGSLHNMPRSIFHPPGNC